MPLKRSKNVPVANLALSTTIAPAWTPATGRRVRLMGLGNVVSNAAITVAFTNGTAAAAGTVGYASFGSGVADDVDFGDAGMYCDLNAILGMKTLAGAGTVSGQLIGREEGW